MVDVIVNKRLDQHNIAKLDLRQTLIELLGITDYAAQKAMGIYYERSEPSEKNVWVVLFVNWSRNIFLP